MVVHHANPGPHTTTSIHSLDQGQIDRMFHALADATRRDIVHCVLTAEASVSTLARRYPMSFAAVQKHVTVLERAGVVTKHRRGREQIVRADIDAVRRATAVLDQFEALWRGRMERFGELLTEPVPTPMDPTGPSNTKGTRP